MPNVRVLRPFMNGHADNIVRPGDVIAVHDDRARDLVQSNLAVMIDETKAAPVPDNKAAPAPSNKASVATVPTKRGPGRPPKVR